MAHACSSRVRATSDATAIQTVPWCTARVLWRAFLIGLLWLNGIVVLCPQIIHVVLMMWGFEPDLFKGSRLCTVRQGPPSGKLSLDFVFAFPNTSESTLALSRSTSLEGVSLRKVWLRCIPKLNTVSHPSAQSIVPRGNDVVGIEESHVCGTLLVIATLQDKAVLQRQARCSGPIPMSRSACAPERNATHS